MMHNYICYFDNVSDISDEISDALCRAVTGEAFQKRELYTDDEDVLYSFIRCIGINGVNLGAQKPDLLSRGLIQRLENIDKTKRLKLKQIRKKFEEIKPQLLGYIFDTLTKVLQVQKKGGIELESYERFPDFEEIGEIISRCMGNNENDFNRAYNKNISLQSDEAIQAHPVGSAVIQLIEDLHDDETNNAYEDNHNVNFKDKEFGGTMSALLTLLEPIAIKLKIDTKDKSWPKQPNTLSRRLNEVTASLREVDIIVERYVIDPHKKTKGIKIRKISSASSASTAIPIVGENDAQLASDNDSAVDAGQADDISYNSYGSSFQQKESIFWERYDGLVKKKEEQSVNHMDEVDKNTVSGQELKMELVSSGKFFIGDAVQIIEDMVRAGKVEEVSFDTYRRSRNKGSNNNYKVN